MTYSPLLTRIQSMHLLRCILCSVLFLLISPLTIQAKKNTTIADGDTASQHYATLRSYDHLFLQAICAREKEDYASMYMLLQGALRLCPQAAETCYLLAEPTQMLYPDDTLRVQHLLESAVTLDSTNIYYLQALGTYYLDRQQWDRAIHIYKQLQYLQPSDDTPLLALLQIYKERGELKEAIAILNRLDVIAGKSEEIAREKYQLYIDMHQEEAAFAEIDDLCAQYPYEPRYKVLKGNLYLQMGQMDKALEIYQDVLRQDSDNIYATLSIATYYEQTGQRYKYQATLYALAGHPDLPPTNRLALMQSLVTNQEQSTNDTTHQTWPLIHVFEQALQCPPPDAALASLYIDYLRETKATDDTLITALKYTIQTNPNYTDGRLLLMLYLMNQRQYTEVIKVCKEGIVLSPTMPVFYYYAGIAYYTEHDSNAALHILQQGLPHLVNDSLKASFISEYYAAMGDIYHDIGQDTKAFAAYDSSLIYNGLNYTALNNYAYYLLQSKRNLDLALQMSKKTILDNPTDETFLDTYARILFARKQYTQAKIYIDQAMKHLVLTQDNAIIVAFAGDVYAVLGDMQTALHYWQKARSLGEVSTLLDKKIKEKRYYSK